MIDCALWQTVLVSVKAVRHFSSSRFQNKEEGATFQMKPLYLTKSSSQLVSFNSFFSNLYAVISPRNITEISYRYADGETAYVCIGFEVSNGKTEAEDVLRALDSKEHIQALDITQNEMAKAHVRFLGGGRVKVN